MSVRPERFATDARTTLFMNIFGEASLKQSSKKLVKPVAGVASYGHPLGDPGHKRSNDTGLFRPSVSVSNSHSESGQKKSHMHFVKRFLHLLSSASNEKLEQSVWLLLSRWGLHSRRSRDH